MILHCPQRGVAIERAAEEFFGVDWGKGPELLRIDFRSVGSLNRLAADRLTRIGKKAESAGRSIVFDNLGALCRDSLEILTVRYRNAA